ncbi:hypothetical protein JW823_05585 [bacterium]|nr:hypothetical protein [candidate division CSSED10-310 bacterium]
METVGNQAPSSQRSSLHNLFIIGSESDSIFRGSASAMPYDRINMGVYSIVPGSDGVDGIQILGENCAAIYVGGNLAAEGMRDLVEVRNAFCQYQDTFQEMVYSSHVNVIVSSLGDPFSAAITPEIAQLSSRNGAVTIGVLSLPHPDEGNRYLQHSRIAMEYTRPHLDSLILLPMESVYLNFASNTMTQHIGEKISQMISRIVRGVVDAMTSQGFQNHERANDVAGFFRGSGELLVAYQEIDHIPNGPYHAIHRCLQEPFHALRRFEGAQKMMVSVCPGDSGLSLEEYLRIGQFCRSELGTETDVVVVPFTTMLRGERPFIVVFGRDIIEKRRDGFDYPYAEVPPEKAPPRLPAYYRKYYGATRRAMGHDISSF